MTQTPANQESVLDDEPIQTVDPLHMSSSSLHPPAEVMSDNDANEKPVREKLKKTSIASISQHTARGHGLGQEVDQSSTIKDDFSRTDLPSEEATTEADLDRDRGRSLRKRSFDGLEIIDTYEDANENNGMHHGTPNGHVRKRSRDVRTGGILNQGKISRGVDATLEEENEDHTIQEATPRLSSHAFDRRVPTSVQDVENPHQMEAQQTSNANHSGTGHEMPSSEMDKAYPDQEMQDSAPSPRKKRSRDQFDAEPDREQKQKIPATEGLRAQRKSDELERIDNEHISSDNVRSNEGHAASQPEQIPVADKPFTGVKIQTPAQFGSSSALSPPSNSTRSVFPTKTSPDTQSQTSASSFAASGFAALAKSSTSPFGTLGASSISAIAPSSFAAPTKLESKERRSFRDAEGGSSRPQVGGGFGSSAKPSSSGAGGPEPPPPQAPGATNSAVFGGSVSGGGFGGGFGGGLVGGFGSGGGKLTSFAAPIGDAKIGTVNGPVKPIGSPKHEGDEDNDSDGEGEGIGEDDQDGADEVDARFQHQDVETGEIDEVTVFSSRASLYTFKDRAWKEGGKGSFKFNLKLPDGDHGPSSGRFIMRAHQTFRVLLNAPVLKEMSIGDRGKEPNGKSFQFAAIEDGKVVPHLLKLGETESKTLYYEVKKLQQDMSDD